MLTSADRFHVVVDTNTLVRAFSNWQSPSGLILEACERREIILLLSAAVVKEYRKVLNYPRIRERNPNLTPDELEATLRRLRYIADYRTRPNVRFPFQRDPDDQKFLELAIAGSATHLVTLDDDLLSVGRSHDEVARRLRRRMPRLRIVRPADFWEEFRSFLAASN